MARQASIASGGYFPTPSDVIPLITKQLVVGDGKDFSYVDPCAGDGSALLDAIDLLHPPESNTACISVYTVELEKTRHAALKENVSNRVRDWRSRDSVLHGDAFKVTWQHPQHGNRGLSLLWLNPPYDIDPQHGRLEEKFLSRFASVLMGRGVLVFLVPFYALKASARTLATEFDDISCFRFPDESFSAYKQVALFATKRSESLMEPDAAIEAMILGWAADSSCIPVLNRTAEPKYEIPPEPQYGRGIEQWQVRSVDYHGLIALVQPWSMTDRSGKSQDVPGILPEGKLDDLLVRKYPIAMPPRSAHIAAGIAAGIFNGRRIGPDDPSSPLPEILVKGVFDKEFRTVDEKTNKDGDTTGLIQIQQPKLVTTVLDLSTNEYVTIEPSSDRRSQEKISDMTMGDLLAAYGRGLMDVMLQQCPVQHDPSRSEDTLELPPLERPLYHAQSHATMAAIKLLGGLEASKAKRRHKSAFVLGEIGSGKTSVALATAEAIKSQRILVMCPPHLLTSWQDQIKAVVPWYRTLVLQDVEDVQRLAALEDDVPTIAIVSRETAKLGHGYEAAPRCGKCGNLAPEGIDHAKKRSRCEFKTLEPRGEFGRLLMNLAYDLLHVFPEDSRVRQVVRTGPVAKMAPNWAAKKREQPSYVTTMWDRLVKRQNLDLAVDALLTSDNALSLNLIAQLVIADPRPDLIIRVARAFYGRPVEPHAYTTPEHISLARKLMLLCPPSKDLFTWVETFRAEDAERNKDRSPYSYYGQSKDPWKNWAAYHANLWEDGPSVNEWEYHEIRRDKDVLLFGKSTVGDKTNALDALLSAVKHSFKWSEECGEPLFQAAARPCRFPLATYICRKHSTLFDLLILDEGHEYATDGSAQERSAHRLTSLGIPTLLLTGTVMNGYAESLFTNMWALSESFRREFDRDERTRFVDRYGYRKRLVEDRDKESGKVVEYGSMSDRIERSERMIGDAPGVLPLFLLRYLLPISVTLHKTDLAIDIPKCSEIVEHVSATSKMLETFERLQTALLRQITKDRFDPDFAGKLWGAMAELPSYLDLATEDVGNTEEGRYEIRYPESVGGALIASAEPLPATTLLPKEAWLLDRVEQSLSEDRNVLVFAWHTKLLPRLSRLIEMRTGEKCPILNPAKVSTEKRERWINQEIINKKRRVMVVNPVTVQTGLNNLVYFADEIWMENPACNPVTYRQAVGRVDRIGQKKPTGILFPLYRDTSQQELHSLLLQKVAVSMSTDGLDGESAMRAAGIGDESGFSSFAVGRQLYELLTKKRAFAA